MFLCLATFCCFYLVQDLFVDYLLCVLSDKCVAGHNERITNEKRVIFMSVKPGLYCSCWCLALALCFYITIGIQFHIHNDFQFQY